MRSILARTRATSCGTRYPRPKRRSARLRVQRVLMQGSSGIGLRLSITTPHAGEPPRASQRLPERWQVCAEDPRILDPITAQAFTACPWACPPSRPPSRVLTGPSRCPTCVALAARVSTWHPCARSRPRSRRARVARCAAAGRLKTTRSTSVASCARARSSYGALPRAHMDLNRLELPSYDSIEPTCEAGI